MKNFRNCFLTLLFGCLLLLAAEPTTVSAEMIARYSSLDMGDCESTFTLSYESPTQTINAMSRNRPVEVSIVNQEHGQYLVKGDAEMGGLDEFSFDVKESEMYYAFGKELYFTIYKGGGKLCTLFYNQDSKTITDINPPGTNLPVHMKALILDGGKYTAGSRFSVMYHGRECWYEVIPYPYDETPSTSLPSNLPDMWYKMTDENNSDEWDAFTYDASTAIFSMYSSNDDGEIELDAYWQFLDNGRQLAIKKVDGESHVRTLMSDGQYWKDDGIHAITKYITDGMKLFLQQQ